MKITLSKKQWEFMGKQAGWMKTSQSSRYYLETWIDGEQMLGSDGTVVFLDNKPSQAKLNNAIKNQVAKFINLSKDIYPRIKEANNITLKLTRSYMNEDEILDEFDVTESIKKNIN
jgi:hypothetical protein